MPDVISYPPHPCLEGSNCCRGKGWSPPGEASIVCWSCWYILFPRAILPTLPPQASKWMKGLPLTLLFPVLILSQFVRSIFPLELLTFWVFFLDQRGRKKKGKEKMQVPWTQVCVATRVSTGTRLPPRAPRQSSFHILTRASPRTASHNPNFWGLWKHSPQVCWYPFPRNLHHEVSPVENMELLTFHVTWGSPTKQHKNNFHASKYLACLKVIELGWIISWADHEKTIIPCLSPHFS